jgi:hypothetical protein
MKMSNKRLIVGVIVVSVLIGLVALPAFAGRYSPTPGGANRWVYVHERLYPEETPRVEDIQTEARKEEGDDLMEGAWVIVAGTGDAIAGTAGAATRTVLGEAEPAEAVVVEKAEVEEAEHTGLFEGTAESISGTANAAVDTVLMRQKPAEDIVVEEIEAEEVEHTGLFEGTWEFIEGAGDAIGGAVSALVAGIFGGEEAEAVEEELPMPEAVPEPEKPQSRRYVPRYHGRMGRWITTRD